MPRDNPNPPPEPPGLCLPLVNSRYHLVICSPTVAHEEEIAALRTRLAMHANTIKQLRERECPNCGYKEGR